MQANMISLVNLTHLYLQGMVSRNDGKIWEKAATPESVAKCGYDAMLKGDPIRINERSRLRTFKLKVS